MKPGLNTRFLMWRVSLAWLMALVALPLQAQLAITEVMSSASTNLGTMRVDSRADFWELTNFGTNAIDLTGHRFSDDAGFDGGVSTIFDGVTIQAGEFVIFAQINAPVCTNAAQFRAWWGETNLPPGLQIYFYSGHGFSSVRDAVQLWRVTAASTTLVQRVELYEARRGLSFTYDLNSGVLNSLSTLGQQGAFKAVLAEDVGSPGFTAGPVPLAIQQPPQGLTVDAGMSATFGVRATGLPVPRFQWRRNGTDIPGANSNTFSLAAAQPADAGSYTVQITNGMQTLASAPAALLVNTVATPPSILTPPADVTVTPGQTAFFSVAVRGYPLPTFQWRFNGMNINGATNRTLAVVDASLSSVGTYSVLIQNPLGSTNASAILAVRPKPNLVITEMMGNHSTNTTISGHADWWELTNFDPNAVNLRGYRFDDAPGVLDGAQVITNDLFIQPGQSVLFIQDMTPEAFSNWWGEENLPTGAQFFRYVGNGIQSAFDVMLLWNATATDPND